MKFVIVSIFLVIIAFGLSSCEALPPSIDLDATATAQIQATTSEATAQASYRLKIGDYVQFGRYNDHPILWRAIEDSANPDAEVGDVVAANILLFSNRIIGNKPFDAAGPHGDFEVRDMDGSNLWLTSNLRAWLNSSAKAGEVIWPNGNPPITSKVMSNGYADEKGFLADGNFTEYERSIIISVTQKSLLYNGDRGRAEGGTTAYGYRQMDEIISNYDTAYYQLVIDKVFILDPKQIYGVYQRFGSFFTSPDEEKYWLHAPDVDWYSDSSPANVLYIDGSRYGIVYYTYAKNGSIGVRPALTLNHQLVSVISGDGSKENPYILSK
jgi:hypothetical protein